jgi:serine/threonine protein kinase/DNA-directed RNA polymerase subunit RPC12/RpoP
MVETWIEKNPRTFPSDEGMLAIANCLPGSIDVAVVKDCFCDKLFPKPQEDSGYHSQERATKDISDLSTDMDVGTAETPRFIPRPVSVAPGQQFTCSTCGKAFSRKGDLKTHEATHKEPRWECPYCQKVLSRRDHLRNHIKKVHKTINEAEREGVLTRYNPDKDRDDNSGGGGSSRNNPNGPSSHGNLDGQGDRGSGQNSPGCSGSYPGYGYTCQSTMSQCSEGTEVLQYPEKTLDASPNYKHSIRSRMTNSSPAEANIKPEAPQNGEAMSLPFRTVGHLGHGAWGSVDKIECAGPGGAVFARKTMHNEQSNENLRRRIYDEVEIMKKLRHPNIVQLEGTFSVGSNFSLLLPVADCDLKQLMHLSPRDKRLAQSNMSLWVCELTSALKYLHSTDISVIHGDLKPANILVYDSHVRITDFGSATFINHNSLSPMLGPITKAYAAPEAINGDTWGKSADVFSLGCVLVEMSTVLMQISLESFEESRSTTIAPGKRDSSFSTHLPHVSNWISKLRARSSRHKFVSRVLDWCERMLEPEPEQRPAASVIAKDMVHSTCSTCSRKSSNCDDKHCRDEEESNCCKKCTTANVPRETGRPPYSLEKFRQTRDDTERVLAGQESMRAFHNEGLKGFMESFDGVWESGSRCYHTFEASGGRLPRC